MNQECALAGKGLWYLFLSELLALLSIVVVFVPLLGWVAAPIMMVVAAVLQFVGPYVARTAHPNFQNAFYMSLVGLLLAVITAFVPEEGFFAALVTVLSSLVSFAVTYFVCTAAETLLADKDGELANRASLIWKLYGGCILVSILATIVGRVPVLGLLVGIASVVASIVNLVAYVLLILFYYKSANTLRAA